MKVKKGERRALKTNYTSEFCLLLEIVTSIQFVEVRWPEVMIFWSHKDPAFHQDLAKGQQQETNNKRQASVSH